MPLGSRSRSRSPLKGAEEASASRKRRREQALVAFEKHGTLEELEGLSLGGTSIVKTPYDPQQRGRGILKSSPRPILKNAPRSTQMDEDTTLHLSHRSNSSEPMSPKKRRVVFDEKLLEELEREKAQNGASKRKVSESGTPYRDTYHHLSSDDEEFLARRAKTGANKPKSPKKSAHAPMSGGEAAPAVAAATDEKKEESVQFQFNVQFNLGGKQRRRTFIKLKHKQFSEEEGALFKAAKRRDTELDDDERGETDEAWKETVLKDAGVKPSGFAFEVGGGSPTEHNPFSTSSVLSGSSEDEDVDIGGSPNGASAQGKAFSFGDFHPSAIEDETMQQ